MGVTIKEESTILRILDRSYFLIFKRVRIIKDRGQELHFSRTFYRQYRSSFLRFYILYLCVDR